MFLQYLPCMYPSTCISYLIYGDHGASFATLGHSREGGKRRREGRLSRSVVVQFQNEMRSAFDRWGETLIIGPSHGRSRGAEPNG